jgi:hypothetical protein
MAKKTVKTVKSGTPNPARKDGWTLIDSLASLFITITPEHVKKAKCKDPTQCVVAQALMAHFNGLLDGFVVGSNITKIFSIGGKTCVRYSTSGALARSLKHFDETQQWNLPPGVYELKPLAASYRREARFNKMKHSGGTKSVFNAGRVAPTRFAPTVCQIMKANSKA